MQRAQSVNTVGEDEPEDICGRMALLAGKGFLKGQDWDQSDGKEEVGTAQLGAGKALVGVIRSWLTERNLH